MYKIEKYTDYNKRKLVGTTSEALDLKALSTFYDENYRWIQVSVEDEQIDDEPRSWSQVLELEMFYLKNFVECVYWAKTRVVAFNGR